MAKYIYKHNNSLSFEQNISSSGQVEDTIQFNTTELFTVEAKGKQFSKEHIHPETVEAFFHFFQAHKEALKNLT